MTCAVPPDARSFAASVIRSGCAASDPIFDRGIQARQILHHHAACTNIHMPNFGIANHIAFSPHLALMLGCLMDRLAIPKLGI
jgi:hypothetical protein